MNSPAGSRRRSRAAIMATAGVAGLLVGVGAAFAVPHSYSAASVSHSPAPPAFSTVGQLGSDTVSYVSDMDRSVGCQQVLTWAESQNMSVTHRASSQVLDSDSSYAACQAGATLDLLGGGRSGVVHPGNASETMSDYVQSVSDRTGAASVDTVPVTAPATSGTVVTMTMDGTTFSSE